MMRLIVLFLCVSFPVFGADYFVSRAGDDQASGSRETPWKTIQFGADRLKPGDTLVVKAGEYPEHVVLRSSGTKTSPIVIRAEEAKKAVLKGGSFFGRDCSFLKLEGFAIVDSKGKRPGIEFTGSGEGVVISKNEIRGLKLDHTAALRVGGRMRDFVIRENHVHHNDTGNEEAIRVHQSTRDFQVIGNKVNHNTNIGIDIVGWAQFGKPTNGLVARNHAHDNGYLAPWSSGIYLDGPNNIIVEYNISSGQDFGFQLGCEPSDDSSKGNIFRYNIAYDNRQYGLGIGGYTGGSVHHCLIHNNVFVNNKRELGFSKNAGHHNTVVNNIFYNPEGQSINFLSRPTDTVIDYNCYFTGYGETPGGNSIKADPLFTDLAKKVFTLKEGSPCIDAGKKVEGMEIANPDIGVFEWQE